MPILREGEIDIISHSAEQTARLGMRLGSLLQPGDIVCLSGDMGAGKTVFTAGIGKGWGTTLQVTSPTFSLVHEYTRQQDKQRLYHLDCYRLSGAMEADAIGLDDILDGNGPVVLEWPERIEDVLPQARLWVDLSVLETTRRSLTFEGTDDRHRRLIERFRELTYGVK